MILPGLGVLMRGRQLPVLVIIALGLHLLTKLPLPFPPPDTASIRTSPFLALFDLFTGGATAHACLTALGLVPYVVATYAVPPRRDQVWWHIPGLTALIAAVLAIRLWLSATPPTGGIAEATMFVLALVAGTFLSVGVVWLCDTYWSVRFDSGTQWHAPGSEAARWRRATGYLFVRRMELEPGAGKATWVSVALTINLLSTVPGYVAIDATTGQIVRRTITLIVCTLLLLVLSMGIRRIPTREARRTAVNQTNRSPFDRLEAPGGLPLAPCNLNLGPLYLVVTAIGLVHLATTAQINASSAWIAALARIEQNVTDPAQWPFWIVLTLAGTAVLYAFRNLGAIPTAETFKKNGTFIPGFRPGAETAAYLHRVGVRLYVPGALLQMLVLAAPMAVAMVDGDTGIWPLALLPISLILQCMERASGNLQAAALTSSYTGLTDRHRARANSPRK
jgi:preprotein translocase subunit SecY